MIGGTITPLPGAAKAGPSSSTFFAGRQYQFVHGDNSPVRRRTLHVRDAGMTPLTMLQMAAGGTKGPGAFFGGRKVGVVWLRSALRLHDNPLLQAAAKECSSVVHVLCFDPRDYDKAAKGMSKVGPSQAACLVACARDLKEQLRQFSNTLVVRHQEAERALADIVRQTGATMVYTEEGIKGSDLKVVDAVKSAVQKEGAQFKAVWCDTLVNPGQLGYKVEQLPGSFKQFKSSLGGARSGKEDATKVEVKGAPVGNVTPGEIPSLETLGFKPSKALQPTCGERHALTQLRSFLEYAKKLDAKKALPFGQLSQQLSKMLSTSMALGCVSPARVLQEAGKAAPRLTQGGKKGNGWLHDYLLHRDYTHLSAFKTALKERKEAAAKSPAQGAPAYSLCNPGQQQAVPSFA